MSTSRKFVWLPFWLGVLLTALGYVIVYPLVARLGCFLLAAGLSAGAVFVTQRGYRIAASLLFIVALASAYVVYRHGQRYLSSSPPTVGLAMAKAPNERAGGDGRTTLLFHAGRAWPAAPQHEC
jgi:membrane protein implicated in regulation of membrane protease activity